MVILKNSTETDGKNWLRLAQISKRKSRQFHRSYYKNNTRRSAIPGGVEVWLLKESFALSNKSLTKKASVLTMSWDCWSSTNWIKSSSGI